MRDLLKFEFFFPDRETHRAQLTAELARMGADWDTPDGEAVLLRADFLIAHRVLRSFVDAQLVVALRLAARNPRTPVVEKEFLDECAAVGQQMLLQGRLHGPESLSRELFASALKLAANRDLVDAGREELGKRREELHRQLERVVADVRRDRRDRLRPACGWDRERQRGHVGRATGSRRRRRGPAGARDRRVLRLRRHADRRLLARARSPATTCAQATSPRSTRAGCCCWACGPRGRGGMTEADFEAFFVLGMRAWAGRSEDELTELGERLWVQGIAGALYPEAWRLVEAHRRAGHTVVFASSATRFQVEPAARAMGVEHVLVTPVEIENGIATGRPGGPPLWRRGKAEAVLAFAPQHGVDLARSFAYSNGTRTCRSCRRSGARGRSTPSRAWRSWPRSGAGRSCGSSPGAAAGLRQVARTAAGAAGMIGGFGAGVALGALNGSRRDGLDLGISLAGELGTALAGVRLDVQGAEYLESARPAVFLFNHQSQLDVMILARLLRGGFTGVAKKEAANVPAFGLMFRLADIAFVDRGNTAQAKAALAPAVRAAARGDLAGHGARRAPGRLRPRSARSRRARSTSRCRRGCRWCRS